MAKATKKTEVLIVAESPEVVAIIEKSGLEISEAKSYAQNFAPNMLRVQDLSKKMEGLDVDNPTPEMAAIARRARLDLVENRGSKDGNAKAIHKQLKEKVLVHGRLIDNLFGVVENSSLMIEAVFEDIEKHAERREAQRKAQLKTDRLEILTPFEPVGLQWMPLDEMTEEQFQETLTNAKEAFEAVKAKKEQDERDRLEAEKKAHAERLEGERIAAEKLAEEKRIAAEQAEAQRLENERLKKEAEEKKLWDDKLQERNQALISAGFSYDGNNFFVGDFKRLDPATIMSLSDESFRDVRNAGYEESTRLNEIEINAKKAADKLAREKDEALKKANVENARIAAELKSKQEAEELAHQKEKERIEAEEAEKAAKEKASRLAPDKEKINALFLAIKNIAMPECKSDEAKQIISEVQDGIKIILEGIKTASTTLK